MVSLYHNPCCPSGQHVKIISANALPDEDGSGGRRSVLIARKFLESKRVRNVKPRSVRNALK